MEKGTYVAKVTSICRKGRHGPYVIAVAESPDVEGSVTFSLNDSVWREENWPSIGSLVVIRNLRKGTRGWRANSARNFIPSDNY